METYEYIRQHIDIFRVRFREGFQSTLDGEGGRAVELGENFGRFMARITPRPIVVRINCGIEKYLVENGYDISGVRNS